MLWATINRKPNLNWLKHDDNALVHPTTRQRWAGFGADSSRRSLKLSGPRFFLWAHLMLLALSQGFPDVSRTPSMAPCILIHFQGERGDCFSTPPRKIRQATPRPLAILSSNPPGPNCPLGISEPITGKEDGITFAIALELSMGNRWILE